MPYCKIFWVIMIGEKYGQWVMIKKNKRIIMILCFLFNLLNIILAKFCTSEKFVSFCKYIKEVKI